MASTPDDEKIASRQYYITFVDKAVRFRFEAVAFGRWRHINDSGDRQLEQLISLPSWIPRYFVRPILYWKSLPKYF